MQPFKAFVLTALQKDRVRVALVTVMTQIWRLQDQPTGEMEEARAHLSNSWDLEVWAAGTLQMHLSLGFESRQVLQINH